MARKASTKLFQLIHSLDKAEKRHFNIFVSRNLSESDHLYLQLFRLVNKQKVYDETALMKAIYGTPQVQTKKFTVLKHKLFNLILQSLALLHEKGNLDFKLKNMFVQVGLLYNKGLYESCLDLLLKINDFASEAQLYNYLLEASRWRKKIAYANADIDFIEKDLKDVLQQEKEWMQFQNQDLDYWAFFLEQFSRVRQAGVYHRKNKELLEDLAQHPCLNANPESLSFESKVFYYYCKSISSYMLENVLEFYTNCKIALDTASSKKGFKKEEYTFYFSLVVNSIVSCQLLNRYEEAEVRINLLENTKGLGPNARLRQEHRYFNAKLSLYTNIGEFEKGKEIMDFIESQNNALSQQYPYDFYYYYAYLNFGLTDYPAALEWTNKVLNLPRSSIRQDVQTAIRFLRLIIYFELKDTDIFESALRSTFRYLRKLESLNAFERLILNFIRKTTENRVKGKEKQALIELKKEVEKCFENPEARKIEGYLNISAWLNSKVNNQPFKTSVRAIIQNRKRQ